MNFFLSIWEKILNFVWVGSKFISLGIKSHRGCSRRVGGVGFILCHRGRSGGPLASHPVRARLQTPGIVAVCRGFALDGKGKEERKKRRRTRCSLSVQDSWLMSSLDMQL